MLAAVAALSANVAFAQDATPEEPAPVIPEYTLNPDPEAGDATDLQNIVLTFEEKVYFYENNRMPAVVLENTTTGVTYYCAEPTLNARTTGTGTEYTLTFVEQSSDEAETSISVPGNYTLTIRAMYLGDVTIPEAGDNDPEDNKQTETTLAPITVNYTIVFPVEYTLNPEAGVATDLQGIVLTFPEDKVYFYENSRMSVAVLENLTTGASYNGDASLNPRSMADGSEYVLAFLDENDEELATITEPGEYLLTVRGMYVGEVTIPEAGDNDPEDVEQTETTLPVLQAYYTIEYPAPYELVPAEGVLGDEEGEIANLQGITINFTENKVAFFENNRIPVAVLENTTTGTEYVCSEPDMNVRAENAVSSYTFMFVNEDGEAEGGIYDVPTEINEPGVYKLTIRGMYISADEEGNDIDATDANALPVITASYIINYPYDYVLTPADGSAVEDLQGITLEFTDTFVSFYENNRMAPVVLKNNTTGAEYVCQEPDRDTFAQTAGVLYTFMFADEDDEVLEAITQPGDYTLTIRAMYVGDVDYDSNEEGLPAGGNADAAYDLPIIVAHYTIEYPYAYVLEPANNAVVSSISKVTLDFYANSDISFYENNRMPVAVITNGLEGDEEVVYTCQEADRNTFAESEGVVYDFYFQDENDEVVEISTVGMWYLTIQGLYAGEIEEATGEEGDTEQTEVTLPAINAVYYVEGDIDDGTTKVVDLTSPDGVYNVYSINGVQVVKNGDVNSLKTLGKGIYVVNGKKVVLK